MTPVAATWERRGAGLTIAVALLLAGACTTAPPGGGSSTSGGSSSGADASSSASSSATHPASSSSVITGSSSATASSSLASASSSAAASSATASSGPPSSDAGASSSGASAASALTCGNGQPDTGEQCDDGNFAPEDGCTDCRTEAGWDCPASGACTPRCGDNLVLGGEACDDGNARALDGCAPDCTLEAQCGNGQKEPGEPCDDAGGSLRCEADCRLTAGDECGAAPDIADPALSNVEGHAFTYEPIPLPPAPAAATAPCDGATTALPWRYVHRFTVGPRPAALLLEAADPLQRGTLPVLWVRSECTMAGPGAACSAPRGPAQTAQLATPVLPARAVMFIVVAFDGTAAPDAFTLRVTELPRAELSPGAACGSAPAVDAAWIQGTLDGPMGVPAGGSCPATGPSAWHRVVVGGSSRVEAAPAVGTVAYLLQDDCSGTVLGCGAGTPVTVNAAAGQLLVGVYGQTDGGAYALELHADLRVADGEPCDAAGTRCDDGLACVGSTGQRACVPPTGAVLEATFAADLDGLVAVDAGGDGLGWRWEGGRAWLAPDVPAAPDEEALESPPLDATSLPGVALWFSHAREAGTARVLVSAAGEPWTEVARWDGATAGPQVLDLTAWAAARDTVRVRWAAAPSAGGWWVDDVRWLAY
ncbi:MAG: DUF4215 domain-containing protein [Deltaproteobacteria bacterium]|nr:DUF4215 domain-containing protein [Deltaproteobacteria bacterium]